MSPSKADEARERMRAAAVRPGVAQRLIGEPPPSQPAGEAASDQPDPSLLPVDRLTAVVPHGVYDRLRRYARRHEMTYTDIVRAAWASSTLAQMPPQRPPAEGHLLSPDLLVTLAGTRRRRVEGRQVNLYLAVGERRTLQAAVTAGQALHLSDVVTKLLEDWLPSR